MRRTLGFATMILTLTATAALAGAPITKEQAMTLLARPGSWLEADGTLLPDGTLQAKDLEVYAPGDTVDCEEPAVYGAIGNLNRTKSSLRVLGYAVTWDELTTLKDEGKRKVLSSKLQDGLGVKVQGSKQNNGSFKATKIKLSATAAGKKPKEKIFGPVTVIDAKSGRMRILDTMITLREDAAFIEHIVTPAK